ncbi:MFS transporter [Streptomyces sp. NPDC046985]|uniref:MFS transporter n=1 Tax=Streptomyces sp. NPDC046985 TaxID=3155377 RepID=UPI0034080BAD
MNSAVTPIEPTARAGRREWTGLAVLALPTLLVSVDVYVMLLALPRLSSALHANSVEQLWVSDIYPFVLAGMLITMGNLGDRFGRRRLLLIGAAAFGCASVGAAYATSPMMLIVARAVMGVAGATLAPSTLSLISTMFRDDRQRGTAIGIWGACFSVGAIVGPLVGGAMLARFWWGSAFLVGIPALVLLLLLGPLLLPEYRAEQPGRLDFVSVVESLAAVLLTIWGVKEFARTGWHLAPLAAVVVGVGLGVVFVRRQHRLTDPLLDLSLFSRRQFSAALISLFLGTMLTGAVMYFVTQTLQLLYGRSPLSAGVWMLPAIAANTVSFVLSPRLGQRFRPAYLIGCGLLLCIAGMVLITQVRAGGSPALLAIGFAVIYLGAGPMVTLGIGLVIGSAPQEKAGSAAALNETSGQLGFALGIAALGSIGTAVYRGTISLAPGLPGSAARSAKDSLASAGQAARRLPGATGDAVLHAARAAFTTELHVVVAIAAVLLSAVAILVTALLRHVPPTGQQQSGAEQGEESAAAAV